MKTHKPVIERILGDRLTASAVSFGAMGMFGFYGPPPSDGGSLAVLDKALEIGVTMIDTADIHGRGHNERLSESRAANTLGGMPPGALCGRCSLYFLCHSFMIVRASFTV